MHMSWPGTGSVPVGLSIANVRLLDGFTGWKWSDIETSAGVYNWTALDTRVTAYRQLGWTVSFCVYGTPTFYASAPDQAFNDQYGKAGGAAYPALDTNLAGLSAFITALVTRYNAAGGVWRAANPTLGKGFTTIETWNEPYFFQNHSGYWWGTQTQLVDLCYTVYAASKAVDSSLLVLGPAWLTSSYCEDWMKYSGTLNSTKTAAMTFDAFNFHCYLFCPYGQTYAGCYADIAWGNAGAYQYIALAAIYKPGAKIYCSEIGFDSFTGTTRLASLLSEVASIRYIHLARSMVILAALGIQRVGPYSMNSTLTGDFVSDNNGVRLAYNTVAAITGKTIVAASAGVMTPVSLTFSDGTSLTI